MQAVSTGAVDRRMMLQRILMGRLRSASRDSLLAFLPPTIDQRLGHSRMCRSRYRENNIVSLSRVSSRTSVFRSFLDRIREETEPHTLCLSSSA